MVYEIPREDDPARIAIVGEIQTAFKVRCCGLNRLHYKKGLDDDSFNARVSNKRGVAVLVCLIVQDASALITASVACLPYR